MEGPSLVIATEELAAFKNKPIKKLAATNAELAKKLKGKKFLKSASWGKHLLLFFTDVKLRIHFLMFGSYRIDNPRENRIPKLQLTFDNGIVYFYSCAIREVTATDIKAYDHSINLMSRDWDERKAVKALRAKPDAMVCDVLMDQSIFSGLGNIMKNEILFLRKLHPETHLRELTLPQTRALVKESQKYAWQFYEWKKANVLKRNWKIFRKRKCPVCGGEVVKRATGQGQRISHYCPVCQSLD